MLCGLQECIPPVESCEESLFHTNSDFFFLFFQWHGTSPRFPLSQILFVTFSGRLSEGVEGFWCVDLSIEFHLFADYVVLWLHAAIVNIQWNGSQLSVKWLGWKSAPPNMRPWSSVRKGWSFLSRSRMRFFLKLLHPRPHQIYCVFGTHFLNKQSHILLHLEWNGEDRYCCCFNLTAILSDSNFDATIAIIAIIKAKICASQVQFSAHFFFKCVYFKYKVWSHLS